MQIRRWTDRQRNRRQLDRSGLAAERIGVGYRTAEAIQFLNSRCGAAFGDETNHRRTRAASSDGNPASEYRTFAHAAASTVCKYLEQVSALVAVFVKNRHVQFQVSYRRRRIAVVQRQRPVKRLPSHRQRLRELERDGSAYRVRILRRTPHLSVSGTAATDKILGLPYRHATTPRFTFHGFVGEIIFRNPDASGFGNALAVPYRSGVGVPWMFPAAGILDNRCRRVNALRRRRGHSPRGTARKHDRNGHTRLGWNRDAVVQQREVVARNVWHGERNPLRSDEARVFKEHDERIGFARIQRR